MHDAQTFVYWYNSRNMVVVSSLHSTRREQLMLSGKLLLTLPTLETGGKGSHVSARVVRESVQCKAG